MRAKRASALSTGAMVLSASTLVISKDLSRSAGKSSKIKFAWESSMVTKNDAPSIRPASPIIHSATGSYGRYNRSAESRGPHAGIAAVQLLTSAFGSIKVRGGHSVVPHSLPPRGNGGSSTRTRTKSTNAHRMRYGFTQPSNPARRGILPSQATFSVQFGFDKRLCAVAGALLCASEPGRPVSGSAPRKV